MLLYQHGRFCIEGVSFAIPDGFYLDCDPEELHVDGLSLYPSDRSCRIDILLEYDSEAPEEALEALFAPDSGMHLRGEIRPVSCNGLTGCEAWYDARREHYYETRFAVSAGKRQHNLCLIVTSSEGPLDELLKRPDIAALRSSLRKD